jgi:hypothetical protein
LSLVRGHPVSFFSQKIKQEGSVFLAVLERGATKHEVIYIQRSLLGERWRVRRSLARAWPKRWGLSQNP